MEFRFLAYLLAGSLVVFIHDIFNVGPGIYFIAMLFWWRMMVAYFAIRREARENGER
jgi:hypothetical protein